MKKPDILTAIESDTLLALKRRVGAPIPVKVLSPHPTDPGCWKVQHTDTNCVIDATSRDLLDPWDVYTVKRASNERERARRRAARIDSGRRQANFLARLADAVSAATGQRWVSTYSGIRLDDGTPCSSPPSPDIVVKVDTPGALLLCAFLSLLPDGSPKHTTYPDDAQVSSGYMAGAERERLRLTRTLTSNEAIQAFGEAWNSTPASEPGARRRAGLNAVAALFEQEN